MSQGAFDRRNRTIDYTNVLIGVTLMNELNSLIILSLIVEAITR